MSIWSAEIKELEKLYESLKGQLPELEKELGQLIHFDDPNVIMLYSRRCLEVIITDLCECELKRPRKTEPLKGIIDKLHKEEKVPSYIISSMHSLNELSTYGAHPKDFDPEQVKPVLNNLDIIIKWYLKYKQIIRIQITKTAEEKVQQREQPPEEIIREDRKKVQEKPDRMYKNKVFLNSIFIIVVLAIAATFLYPKIFRKDTLEKLRSSGERIAVAVMPFQNMTNDTIWNVWQDGIQNELITSLTNSEELKVRQTESINNLIQSKGLTNYASITPSIASTISQKLDANIFIYGSIKQVGKTIRINAQLIDSKTENTFKSFQIDGIAENILQITDSLSNQIKNFLIISELEKELPVGYRYYESTNSPEAFKYFIYGQNAFNKRDFSTAANFFSQAIAIDSNFTSAALSLSTSYLNQRWYDEGMLDEAKKWCLILYKKRNQMPMELKIRTNKLYASLFETPYEEIEYIKQLQELDDQSPRNYYNLGFCYNKLYQYDKAIQELEKVLEIYNKWGTKPLWAPDYTQLGFSYHETGQYKKEKKLYKKAEQDFPDDASIIYMQAILSLTEGDTLATNKYIKKYLSNFKNYSPSDAYINSSLAYIYSEAGFLDKSEKYYRQALSLEPENPVIMNYLAYLLIDKDKNVNEGMELVEKALELLPDSWSILDTKGWGLYKQGKYNEALELIEKAWNLKPVYDHELYLHLEATKKAIASQKNN